MKNFLSHIVLFIVLTFILACQNEKEAPDVSNIKASANVHHFSEDLFSIDTTKMVAELHSLKKKYPAFFSLYFTNVLPILQDTSIDENSVVKIRNFITDKRIVKLYDTTQVVYQSFKPYKEQLKSANKFIKYYFPDKKPPSYYTFISEYSYAAFIFSDSSGRDGIGIGLDMFLGPSYNYRAKNPYDNSFSDYLVRKYTPDFLVKRAIESWVTDKLALPKQRRLIDNLIYEGKKLYLLDKLIPSIQDTVLFGYKADQLKWVKANEQNIWAHLLSEDLLYTKDKGKVTKLINPAPHSSGMPKKAPGQAILYCGYKIIDNYMKLHPELSLRELMQLTDSQDILSNARYKPSI